MRDRWCHPPESNWGHHDFQSCALPTELGWRKAAGPHGTRRAEWCTTQRNERQTAAPPQLASRPAAAGAGRRTTHDSPSRRRRSRRDWRRFVTCRRSWLSSTGSVTTKTEDHSSSLRTRISPPCSRTICCAMPSPSAAPAAPGPRTARTAARAASPACCARSCTTSSTTGRRRAASRRGCGRRAAVPRARTPRCSRPRAGCAPRSSNNVGRSGANFFTSRTRRREQRFGSTAQRFLHHQVQRLHLEPRRLELSVAVVRAARPRARSASRRTTSRYSRRGSVARPVRAAHAPRTPPRTPAAGAPRGFLGGAHAGGGQPFGTPDFASLFHPAGRSAPRCRFVAFGMGGEPGDEVRECGEELAIGGVEPAVTGAVRHGAIVDRDHPAHGAERVERFERHRLQRLAALTHRQRRRRRPRTPPDAGRRSAMPRASGSTLRPIASRRPAGPCVASRRSAVGATSQPQGGAARLGPVGGEPHREPQRFGEIGPTTPRGAPVRGSPADGRLWRRASASGVRETRRRPWRGAGTMRGRGCAARDRRQLKAPTRARRDAAPPAAETRRRRPRQGRVRPAGTASAAAMPRVHAASSRRLELRGVESDAVFGAAWRRKAGRAECVTQRQAGGRRAQRGGHLEAFASRAPHPATALGRGRLLVDRKGEQTPFLERRGRGRLRAPAPDRRRQGRRERPAPPARAGQLRGWSPSNLRSGGRGGLPSWMEATLRPPGWPSKAPGPRAPGVPPADIRGANRPPRLTLQASSWLRGEARQNARIRAGLPIGRSSVGGIRSTLRGKTPITRSRSSWARALRPRAFLFERGVHRPFAVGSHSRLRARTAGTAEGQGLCPHHRHATARQVAAVWRSSRTSRHSSPRSEAIKFPGEPKGQGAGLQDARSPRCRPERSRSCSTPTCRGCSTTDSGRTAWTG